MENNHLVVGERMFIVNNGMMKRDKKVEGYPVYKKGGRGECVARWRRNARWRCAPDPKRLSARRSHVRMLHGHWLPCYITPVLLKNAAPAFRASCLILAHGRVGLWDGTAKRTSERRVVTRGYCCSGDDESDGSGANRARLLRGVRKSGVQSCPC